MDNSNLGHHISQQFNEELEEIRSLVLAMGGLVEEQIRDATNSLVDGDVNLAETVISRDVEVNMAEVSIDEECNHTRMACSRAASRRTTRSVRR